MDCILGKCSVGFQRHMDLYQQNMTEALNTLEPLGKNFLRNIHQHQPTDYPPEKVKGPSFPTKQYKPLAGRVSGDLCR